jgi:hypothetical protein
MEASVGLRVQPRAWAGLEKPRGSSSAVSFAPEKLQHSLSLGTDPRRSAGPVRAAKLKAPCCKASAGKRFKCLFPSSCCCYRWSDMMSPQWPWLIQLDLIRVTSFFFWFCPLLSIFTIYCSLFQLQSWLQHGNSCWHDDTWELIRELANPGVFFLYVISECWTFLFGTLSSSSVLAGRPQF